MLTLTADQAVEILFIADLDHDMHPSLSRCRAAINARVAGYDGPLSALVAYCLACMADEYGDHPVAAAERAAWAVFTVDELALIAPEIRMRVRAGAA